MTTVFIYLILKIPSRLPAAAGSLFRLCSTRRHVISPAGPRKVVRAAEVLRSTTFTRILVSLIVEAVFDDRQNSIDRLYARLQDRR